MSNSGVLPFGLIERGPAVATTRTARSGPPKLYPANIHIQATQEMRDAIELQAERETKSRGYTVVGAEIVRECIESGLIELFGWSFE